ncbi:MAG TPA: hypothetical protein VFV98_09380 [Vicinamibacterales bacterium]|nr:hypothetical protein [Vicinamibacterales bacterium]
MRSNKTFSSVPFTKRVDYDGGAHRGARAMKGPLVCRKCGALYYKRRWLPATDPLAQEAATSAARTTCRSCEMISKGLVAGYLRLEGEFVRAHHWELTRLLEREAERALQDNPTGRMISVPSARADVITVAATTEHLIERLGRAIEHAYDGEIKFGFGHGNKFARAVWHRD